MTRQQWYDDIMATLNPSWPEADQEQALEVREQAGRLFGRADGAGPGSWLMRPDESSEATWALPVVTYDLPDSSQIELLVYNGRFWGRRHDGETVEVGSKRDLAALIAAGHASVSAHKATFVVSVIEADGARSAKRNRYIALAGPNPALREVVLHVYRELVSNTTPEKALEQAIAAAEYFATTVPTDAEVMMEALKDL